MEFNLSEKREGAEAGEVVYYEQDVKKFIRLLKEEIESKKHLLDYQEREFYLKLIDKLAGDELTGEMKTIGCGKDIGLINCGAKSLSGKLMGLCPECQAKTNHSQETKPSQDKFNLSEKIMNDYESHCFSTNPSFLLIPSVKKFIRLLKEKIDIDIFSFRTITKKDFKEIIDKLAGDELTGDELR